MKINVYIERNGLNSKGIYDSSDESIIVLKGSKVSKTIRPHFKDTTYYILREELERNGIIKDFIFTKNYEFHKTSPASSVILGSNTNGKKEWITENGNDLNSLGLNKINFKLNVKNDSLFLKLLNECDREAEKMVKQIDEMMIERTNVNVGDVDSMINDIISLREKKEKIIKNKNSQDFFIKVMIKLWNQHKENIN